jgi:hypothetical protein
MSAQLQCQSEAALPRKKVEPASPMPDIDSQDANDPLNACDYVADIFSYWRRVEPQFRVGPEYMTRQVRNPALQTTLPTTLFLDFSAPEAALLAHPTTSPSESWEMLHAHVVAAGLCASVSTAPCGARLGGALSSWRAPSCRLTSTTRCAPS